MSSTPRPSQLYKLALIFPVGTDNPAFRWVEFKYEDAGPESWEEPVHQPHLGPADSCGEVYFNRVEISKRLLNSLPNKSMIWINRCGICPRQLDKRWIRAESKHTKDNERRTTNEVERPDAYF